MIGSMSQVVFQPDGHGACVPSTWYIFLARDIHPAFALVALHAQRILVIHALSLTVPALLLPILVLATPVSSLIAPCQQGVVFYPVFSCMLVSLSFVIGTSLT